MWCGWRPIRTGIDLLGVTPPTTPNDRPPQKSVILLQIRQRMKRVPAISLSLIATAVAVRASLIFRYRFDSDEPQHMDVGWCWAHGLPQYRDVFDNHMPLFHLLSSPLFAATGDDPRLLYAARLSMLPLFLAALFLVWRIARTLFDETPAGWSTVRAAVVPPFFLGSLEYRTDD